MSDPTESHCVEDVVGTGVPIYGNDIDTDQITPARFLKVVTFDGLAQFAFFDQRFDENDTPKQHPMNDPRFDDASIMVVNSNFGCGSSREHAPQALMRWGIDAFIGESFADIFADNCLALGLPTVRADAETIQELQHWIDENPAGEISLGIRSEELVYGNSRVTVDIDEGVRKALLKGIWDSTALLKSHRQALTETANSLPYIQEFD